MQFSALLACLFFCCFSPLAVSFTLLALRCFLFAVDSSCVEAPFFFVHCPFSPLASRCSLLFSLFDYYFSKLATLQYLFAIHYLIHAARYSQTRCSLSSPADRCSLRVTRFLSLSPLSITVECWIFDLGCSLLACDSYLIAAHTFFLNARSSL